MFALPVIWPGRSTSTAERHRNLTRLFYFLNIWFLNGLVCLVVESLLWTKPGAEKLVWIQGSNAQLKAPCQLPGSSFPFSCLDLRRAWSWRRAPSAIRAEQQGAPGATEPRWAGSWVLARGKHCLSFLGFLRCRPWETTVPAGSRFMAHGVNVAARILHLAPGLLQTSFLPFAFSSEIGVHIHQWDQICTVDICISCVILFCHWISCGAYSVGKV